MNSARRKPPAKARPARALYLYGISPALKKQPLFLALGIDGKLGHRVMPLDCAGLVCWVSELDAGAFTAELERNSDNLEWMAEAGLRHQQAVAAITSQQDLVLLPTRFGVVFSSEEALETDVRKRKAELARAFKRVSGADEWGVKVFMEKPPAAASKSAAASKNVTQVSGRDYLRTRAQALDSAQRPKSDPEVRKLAAALKKQSRAVGGSGALSDTQPKLQWQASFLVARNKSKKFAAVLRQFARRWDSTRSIEVSGPWPPYSFVHGA